jgi:hypothetical protein
VNVTPLGKAPISDNVGVGEPLAMTWKLPCTPTVVGASCHWSGTYTLFAFGRRRRQPPSVTLDTMLITCLVAVAELAFFGLQ